MKITKQAGFELKEISTPIKMMKEHYITMNEDNYSIKHEKQSNSDKQRTIQHKRMKIKGKSNLALEARHERLTLDAK